jgi:hypothetical protein
MPRRYAMLRNDFGHDEFREIGKLSSMLPAYIRQCCRAMFDGTDDYVLESYRLQAYKILLEYRDKYQFVKPHIDLMGLYSPSEMKGMIGLVKPDGHDCFASNTSLGMPKRACLHCHYVGKYLSTMRKAGTVDEATGRRWEKNGTLRKK